MKQYTFTVVITEGNDEYWEELAEHNNSGCDEIKEMLCTVLDNSSLDFKVTLTKYTNES